MADATHGIELSPDERFGSPKRVEGEERTRISRKGVGLGVVRVATLRHGSTSPACLFFLAFQMQVLAEWVAFKLLRILCRRRHRWFDDKQLVGKVNTDRESASERRRPNQVDVEVRCYLEIRGRLTRLLGAWRRRHALLPFRIARAYCQRRPARLSQLPRKGQLGGEVNLQVKVSVVCQGSRQGDPHADSGVSAAAQERAGEN